MNGEPAGPRGPSDRELREAVPQDAKRRDIRVGIFVLLGVVGVLATLFLLTDPATLRGRYLLVTRVEDAGGIRRGDPVLMRGVNIGRIHAFSMTQAGRVDITMEIEGEWDVPVDSHTQLEGAGIFGGRNMVVIRGAADESAQPMDTILGVGDAGDVIETAEALGETAEEVLAQVRRTLDEATVESVRSSASDLQFLLEELRAIAAVQRDQLAELTESLGRSAAGVEAAGPALSRMVERSDSALASLSRTSTTLDRAATSLEAVLGRMAAGEGTLGRLSRDDSLYVNLNSMVAALGALAEDLRENPRRYLNLELF